VLDPAFADVGAQIDGFFIVTADGRPPWRGLGTELCRPM